MLTVEALMILHTKPTINNIDIPLLAELYEQILHPNTYVFNLSDKNQILLNFDLSNFCHLIGLESMMRTITTKPDTLKMYKGNQGWDNIKSGEINIAHMKSKVGKTRFGDAKDKMVFFFRIPAMLSDGKAMIRYKKIAGSKIECELIIYNEYDNAYVHLGIEKSGIGEYYCPRSFWIERKTTSSPGNRYISGQNVVKIEEMKKIGRLESQQPV